jgi:hypothetical protein
MQRQTWSGMIIAAIFAVSGVVMAQSPASQAATRDPSTSTPPATQAAPSQAASPNHVTVTGCLREASPGAAATGGSAAPAPTDAKSNAPADAKFVLADASPTGTATSAPQTYELVANESALAPHVGKKLEFTGTVEASASGQPRLHAESAKVIAADCTK